MYYGGCPWALHAGIDDLALNYVNENIALDEGTLESEIDARSEVPEREAEVEDAMLGLVADWPPDELAARISAP